MIKIATRNDIEFSKLLGEAFERGYYTDEESMFYGLYTESEDFVLEIALGEFGVALVWNYPPEYEISGEQIGVYVRVDHRRKGYGTELVEALGMRQWRVGGEGSLDFWLKFKG